jgi:hypothetical protein
MKHTTHVRSVEDKNERSYISTAAYAFRSEQVQLNQWPQLCSNLHNELFTLFGIGYAIKGGARWCIWLRHCATSRKVADSIPDGVIGIFHRQNGVDSASNRNENQKYRLEGKGGRCVGLTTLPPSCADCLEIWEPSGPVQACNRDYFTCTIKTCQFDNANIQQNHLVLNCKGIVT